MVRTLNNVLSDASVSLIELEAGETVLPCGVFFFLAILMSSQSLLVSEVDDLEDGS